LLLCLLFLCCVAVVCGVAGRRKGGRTTPERCFWEAKLSQKSIKEYSLRALRWRWGAPGG